jgi:hypothetical protein
MQRLRHKLQRGLYNYWQLYIQHALPVAVYTTGRVGSTSLYNSLNEHPDVFAFKIESLATEAKRQKRGSRAWFYEHIVKAKRPAKLITVVRDPLALMLGEFYSKLHWITGRNLETDFPKVDELVHLFNTVYFEEHRHLEKLRWFEKEYQAVLGINIYQEPSPAQNGFISFTSGNYNVLIQQLEQDNALRSQQVAEFLALSDFTIRRDNVRSEKIAGGGYEDFKKQVIVLPQHLDTVYKSDYANYCYSPSQIEAFRETWKG